jgi:hypothetical protein
MLQPDTIHALQQAIGDGGARLFQSVPLLIGEILDRNLWQERADQTGKPFASFVTFAEAPLWEGLGVAISDLRLWCRRRPDVLQKLEDAIPAAARPGAPEGSANNPAGRRGGGTKGDNITFSSGSAPPPPPEPKQRGTGAAYLVARLKRDAPEFAEALGRGEYPSARAAVRAADLQTKDGKPLVRDPTPLELLHRAWRKASTVERTTFLKEVQPAGQS